MNMSEPVICLKLTAKYPVSTNTTQIKTTHVELFTDHDDDYDDGSRVGVGTESKGCCHTLENANTATRTSV